MGFFEKFKNIFSRTDVKDEPRATESAVADVAKNDEIEADAQNEATYYHQNMQKSRAQLVSAFTELVRDHERVDDAYFTEVEDALIMADVGIHTVMNLSETLQERVQQERVQDPQTVNAMIVEELYHIYLDNVGQQATQLQYAQKNDEPTVFLFVGVNGAGKTTSIGKLAYRLQQEGKRVLLVAGDTFRAGAIDQLAVWAKRIDAGFVSGKVGADPSAVMFDGMQKARAEGYDVVLCDTAGRLQNKVNLMRELEKMYRVIKKELPDAPQETLLVIDATTGQNGLVQAKAFTEVAPLTGVILSKLDGTAKGGIVLAIAQELHIPVKFIGLGEQKEDIAPFVLENYLYGLFSDLFEDA